MSKNLKTGVVTEMATDDHEAIMVAQFTRDVAASFVAAERITIFRDLSKTGQVGTFATGILSGLVGLLMFGTKTSEDRDRVFDFLKETLDVARVNGEASVDEFQRRRAGSAG